MPTFQKKTSDLLKEQKASYSAMVKSALKGKTGLTRAQVNKTIKGVAKDYREQYGATPRKRYLNAVKQAASTMPKAAKATKTKATTASKSKTTSTPLPKSEAQRYAEEVARKSEERIRRRNERIRQRTEAAFANHKADLMRRRAEQAKSEAEQKAADKAKYLTSNETFIKQFAADLGLSTATIKAMYKVACDYRHEKLRIAMCGLYCDPEGYLVATDAHILVAIKCKMPAKYKGKIYLKSGMVENSKYPNWQMVMPIRSGVPNADYTHTDKYSASLLIAKGKTPADDEYTTIKDAEGDKIGLMIELINVLDRLFKTLKENEIKIYTKSPSHSVLFTGKHFVALQMPILLSK